jgi:hypothetical protein
MKRLSAVLLALLGLLRLLPAVLKQCHRFCLEARNTTFSYPGPPACLGGPALPTAKTNKHLDFSFSTYLENELKRNCPS